MSASIISAIGLQELITCNLQTYETRAVRLAQVPVQLSGIRNKLEQNRLKQPLFDAARFTTNLEKAFQEMVRIYAAGKRPRPITVKDE